tara:strand:+ start:3052 stop:3606 length:555 start_codon:yes stop_codon:yes gene_type:complete
MNGADAGLQEWLTERGYHLYLADNYNKINKPMNSRLMNVIAIHEQDTKNNCYYKSLTKSQMVTMKHDDWETDADGFYFKTDQLQTGRYVLSFVPTQAALNDHSKAELSIFEGESLVRKSLHISPWSHLSQSYTDQPFHLNRDNQVVIRLSFDERKDLKDAFETMSLLRVDSDQPPWADKKRCIF